MLHYAAQQLLPHAGTDAHNPRFLAPGNPLESIVVLVSVSSREMKRANARVRRVGRMKRTLLSNNNEHILEFRKADEAFLDAGSHFSKRARQFKANYSEALTIATIAGTTSFCYQFLFIVIGLLKTTQMDCLVYN